jgi:DNA-binding IscR family transcriptional regulator
VSPNRFDDVGERHRLLGRAQCGNRAPCAVHGRWGEVADSLQGFVRNTTIADLMNDASAAGVRARP